MTDEEELVSKVRKLMTERFGGTDVAARKKLFEAYDKNGDGQVDQDEMKQLLADAGVGNGLTRGAWVRGVIKKLDSDDDKTISYDELERIFAS